MTAEVDQNLLTGALQLCALCSNVPHTKVIFKHFIDFSSLFLNLVITLSPSDW